MDDRWIGKHFFSLGSREQGTRSLALVLEIVYKNGAFKLVVGA
jgi:hypothetical protein